MLLHVLQTHLYWQQATASNGGRQQVAAQDSLNKMDNNEMPTMSCTRLSLTTLTDEVWTLFTQKQQKENTLNQLSDQLTTKESAKPPTTKKKIRSVNFQCPVITKTHHLPMTEEQDMKILFFTEQEMEEIKDDRNATKFTDDVEVLAEGQDWDEASLQSSHSGSNLSIEEGYVVENILSPRSESIKALSILSERNSNPRRKKKHDNNAQDTDKPKIVQGVQIMLREKSNNLYLM